MSGKYWTDQRVQMLKDLWKDDAQSAAKIAKKLGGGVTRNAVIGKAHRLHLPSRAHLSCAPQLPPPRSPAVARRAG